ncbi:DUF4062 domain-containing protein [Rhizobium sp. P40RR-XXII]|uniref:DUF4062 domain-containing protein n=1 Tax=unclassified Rhizobium TaxID=2613769 RepID=UPI001456BEDA|nr:MULTISPECIES: DUF4062 domain-containing protein [unclassified Rhizobium]NLR87192.1 DUF4062 domain-containing protein [Rhizobium sp. P28RR-XV]NLS19662.1 DUF4062 domain-containing protein [Rhizobium sp. P40RR-XXII]
MAAKKYQVFVSSTFRDLVDERQDAIRNILDLNHIPAGMELFPAADIEQLGYIKKVIDECDYYLLIIGGRYGSMDAEGVSFTEREYDYAIQTGKVVLAFVHEDPSQIAVGKSDIEPGVFAALQAFRQKVVTGRLVKTWTSRQSLESLVLKALMHAFNQMPQVGWIRGDTAANEQVLEQANRALQDNATLRAELTMLKGLSAPKYENLAGLEDEFTFRYRTRRPASQNSIKYNYTDRTMKMKWRAIFLPLAADLTTAKVDGVISNAVKLAMQEAKCEYNPFDINDMDLATIKAQFIALNLISANVGQSTKGTYHEFLSLTPRGRSTYMEAIVVRKDR